MWVENAPRGKTLRMGRWYLQTPRLCCLRSGTWYLGFKICALMPVYSQENHQFWAETICCLRYSYVPKPSDQNTTCHIHIYILCEYIYIYTHIMCIYIYIYIMCVYTYWVNDYLQHTGWYNSIWSSTGSQPLTLCHFFIWVSLTVANCRGRLPTAVSRPSQNWIHLPVAFVQKGNAIQCYTNA